MSDGNYRLIPGSQEGLDLLQRGSVALAKVESTGITIDIAYLDKAIVEVRQKIKSYEKQLCETDLGKKWITRFQGRVNFQSGKQLADVLQKDLDIDLPKTAKGNAKTDASVLFNIDDPFVKMYTRMEQWGKAEGTYLRGIKRETVDGVIHPFFNLYKAVSYRSSSEDINFQNIPVRDKEIGPLIRKVFVPREGRSLLETDYSGMEVHAAAWYHKDPTMIEYLSNPTKDMHRDMASQIYMVPTKEVEKQLRDAAKSFFVFAEFYGDYFAPCAKNLWETLVKKKLKTVSGEDVRTILKSKGIRKLGEIDEYGRNCEQGTFLDHLKSVEDDFWNVRFPVYGEWREQLYADYLVNGYFKTLSGFICRGMMRRNQVWNYGTQGTAFHCLLRALIKLVNGRLKKEKMRSVIVGQIHDSLMGDVPHEEEADYCALMQTVMVDELKREWEFIITPINIEISKYETSWGDKPWKWDAKNQKWSRD